MDKTTAVAALQNAVAYLKGQQKIKKDNEISSLTGFTRSAVSSYLSGAAMPSKNFLAKFEQVFGLRLTDFVGAVEVKNPAGAGMESLILQN